ncbi:MAG: TonB-dependent receptor [Burkholderiales bacterium]|nr:TonB-dependent receptor [Burkholderiales bacterium]
MTLHKRLTGIALSPWYWALFPLASLSAAACASAGNELTDLPIEQLLAIQISTASKFPQALTEAPSAVSVITAAEIQTYGWRSLADLLASVRSLYVTNDRNYMYLGGRGFLRPGDYNSRFLLLVDGHRNNDAIYDQASLGQDFNLDLDLVDRVEFVPGPGSSIYGSNAFFGVINVITRRGRDLPGPLASVTLGSAGERNAHASYGWSTDDGHAEFLLAAGKFRRDGRDLYFPEFDSPATNRGIAHGLDYEQGDRLFFKAGVGALTFSAAHVARSKGIPTASFSQAFNDPRSRTDDSQSNIAFSYSKDLDAQNSVSARLFWGSHDYYGAYLYADPDKLNDDGSSSSWWGGEFNLVSTHFNRHKLLAGLEYQRDYKLHQFSADNYPANASAAPAYIPLLDDRRRAARSGIYLQDEYSASDSLLINLGLRHDHNSLSSGALSPRLALIYKLSPERTLKAIAGNAFRSPNSFELYYATPGPGGQKINPALKPERIRTRELSLEQQLSAGSKLLLSVYRNEVSGLISQTLDETDRLLVFQNLSRAVARGAEAEYERIWNDGSRLRGSYSWQRVTDGASGATLVNSPRHLGKLNLSVPLAQGQEKLGLEAQYVGQRDSLRGRLGGYWLANLTLLSTRIRHTDLSFSVYNLGDRRYAVPGAEEHLQDVLQQDGRSYRLQLTYRY